MKIWGMGILGMVATVSAHATWTPEPEKNLGELPGSVMAWERTVKQGDRSVQLSGVSFDTKNCELQVLDNPPEARQPLTVAMKAAGAVAGVNGGYFHPDDRPLGLVVAGGKTLHGFERAKLLSGIFMVRDGRASLVRSEKFSPLPPIKEALQAGPWLVEDGKPVSGLQAGRLARRTVVARVGRSRWVLLVTSPVTLAELGEILVVPGVLGEGSVADALNLDGGSSSLLVASKEGRALLDIPSFGSVRNYLAIVPRRR